MISINEDKLIDYILGLSNESERQLIEANIQTSTDLQERIAQLYDTLAIPALTSEPIDPTDKLSMRILKSIEISNSFEGFIDRLTVFLDLPEQRVRELLGSIKYVEHDWRESGLPGVLKKEFKGGPRHTDSECVLIWMKPNAIFPSHGHLGDEWGFVLQGEAEEDSGRVYKSGDIVYQTTDSKHTFTATGDMPFIFFVIHNGISFSLTLPLIKTITSKAIRRVFKKLRRLLRPC